MEKSSFAKGFVRVWSVLAIFGGGGLCLLGAGELISAFQAKNWPSVEATKVELNISKAEKGKYTLKAAYEFMAQGKKFSGEKIRFGVDNPSSDSLTLERFKETKFGNLPVIVHFDPGNPRVSVLLTEVTILNFTWLIGGLIFFLAGLLLIQKKFRNWFVSKSD
jgi:hypothetical protein